MNRAIHLRCSWLVLLAVTVACSEGIPDTTLPTTPTSNITEDVAGTLNPSGGVSHPFVVVSSTGGTVLATVTSVTLANPESVQAGALILGISLGTWNGVSCAVASGIFNDFASTGSTVTGNVTASGAICVRVYDVGQLTENVNYTVQVVHP